MKKLLLICLFIASLSACKIGEVDAFHYTYVPPEARTAFENKFNCAPGVNAYCGTIELVQSTAASAVVSYIPAQTSTAISILDGNGLAMSWLWQDSLQPVTNNHLGLIMETADIPFWSAQSISVDYLPSDFNAPATRCRAVFPIDWDRPWPNGVWTPTGIKFSVLCEPVP